MKAMKATKAMKKKSGSKIARGRFAKSVVLRVTKEKTVGGLSAKDLMVNKRGKIVSKKAAAAGKKNYSNISAWTKACQKARAALKLKGFVACKKGSPFYKKAKELYQQ